MVSNSLSARRQILARPIVCKKGPPPIPAPLPPWPPDTFSMEVTHDRQPWFPIAPITGVKTLTRVSPTFLWVWDDILNDPGFNFTLLLSPTTQQFNLQTRIRTGWNTSATTRINHPMSWGVSSIYVVTAWTTTAPFAFTAKASFTF